MKSLKDAKKYCRKHNLEFSSAIITEIAAPAPKDYSYIIEITDKSGQIHHDVHKALKGFSLLNKSVDELITLDRMRTNIFSKLENNLSLETYADASRFGPSGHRDGILSRSMQKRYTWNFDKRQPYIVDSSLVRTRTWAPDNFETIL